MKLNKLLLFAAGGIVAYKVLSRVKVVKVDFPEDIFLGDITDALYNYTDEIKAGEDKEKAIEKLKGTLESTKNTRKVYGGDLAKAFENTMKNNENKTNMSINEKVIKLASERPITIHDASYEAAKLIRGYKEVSE